VSSALTLAGSGFTINGIRLVGASFQWRGDMHVRGIKVNGLVAVMAGALVVSFGSVVAQVPKRTQPAPKPGFPPKAAPAPAVKGKGKAAKLPDPEVVSLETKDGVSIKATYYPGTAKKEAVPVILIHGYGGQRHEYHAFALHLQSLGHAAIAPDLRGHGQSTTAKLLDGSTATLDSDKFNRKDLEAMVLDVEACKRFLMEKNNAGELNIELLTVVGADFGTILAVRWAAADWAVPDLPAYKQGKDVKALVLLSPMASFKAVTMREALTYPAVQKQLSIMLVAGSKDTKSAAEAKKIYDALQRHHPKLPDDPEERRKLQELYLVNPDTVLTGTKLLGDAVAVRDLTVKEMISIFIDRRLVQRKQDFAWQNRESPL
jgi:pimeloyl-ACP methyl ester carboxylesterase